MAIVNTTAAREHVTDCERGIRTIKESARCTVSEMRRVEIKVLPKQVIIHLIYFVIMWLNGGPNENGISQVYSPREIVTGRTLEYKLHCKANFGQYVHAHHDPDKTNGMQNRTFPGIYLGPTGNMQGTVKVLDLNTGRVKKPKTFTEVPMPASVVKLVNDWGKKYQKTERKESIEFRNRNKEKYSWDNDEYEDDQPVIENDHVYAGIPAEFPGIDIDNEDDGPGMELLEETDEERVLAASRETGITTRGMNIEGVTTAVDLIDDDDNSDSNDESEPPSLEDPDSSNDEDSDDEDDDDAGGDAQAINHI